MSMSSMLREKPKLEGDDVELALQGNLCRCTGYRPIIEGFRYENLFSFLIFLFLIRFHLQNYSGRSNYQFEFLPFIVTIFPFSFKRSFLIVFS